MAVWAAGRVYFNLLYRSAHFESNRCCIHLALACQCLLKSISIFPYLTVPNSFKMISICSRSRRGQPPRLYRWPPCCPACRLCLAAYTHVRQVTEMGRVGKPLASTRGQSRCDCGDAGSGHKSQWYVPPDPRFLRHFWHRYTRRWYIVLCL